MSLNNVSLIIMDKREEVEWIYLAIRARLAATAALRDNCSPTCASVRGMRNVTPTLPESLQSTVASVTTVPQETVALEPTSSGAIVSNIAPLRSMFTNLAVKS